MRDLAIFLIGAICCAAIPTVSACRRITTPAEPLAQGTVGPAATRADDVPEVFSVQLSGPPAGFYRAEAEVGTGSPLERRVRGRFPGLRIDPCLQRAAAAHLEVETALVDHLPLAFTEFAMHWAGCPDPSATVSVLLTTEDGDEALLDQIEELTANEEYTHIGVARDAAEPPYRARWLVLLTNRLFTLRPVPTSVEGGGTLPLQFRVDDRFARVTVAVTRPRGEIETFNAGLGGGQAVAAVPIAGQVGRQWIELIGHGRQGPHVLALFPVAIGRPPPEIWVGSPRPDERWVDTVEEAEELASDLIRKDRARFDLPEIQRDPRLDAIARQHSIEMASSGYFAHVSPSTGSVADRLQAQGYQASFAAENIAMGSLLIEAQESLMRSPGHRAAILSPEATHFGVGVAFRDQEVGPVSLLTQVFVTRLEDADR
jgi:uncharacterized protein YkwD